MTERRSGFTLIEMSIVLVIVGLITGGVLVGRDLIQAAYVRATISQVERFNTSFNTFRGKYNALPGDINSSMAAQFGFAARGTFAGEGDGNGIIEGVSVDQAGKNYGYVEYAGETVMAWVDLSSAGLIDGGFRSANSTTGTGISNTELSLFFPAAKLGQGNYFYIFSTGPTGASSINYFGFSVISGIADSSFWCFGCVLSTPGLSVRQAYNIDRKVDDGFPQSGNATTIYLDANVGGALPVWAGGNTVGANVSGAPATYASPGSINTCYDNSASATGSPGVNGAPMHYSLEISGGAAVTCAMSFQFQ